MFERLTHSASKGPGGGPPTPEYALGSRRSYAFEQITRRLAEQPYQHVLDFGGLNQPNLDFFSKLGQRLYSEDLLLSIDTYFTAEEIEQRYIDETRLERFLDESLDFPDQSTDAALCWDVLQFVPPVLCNAIVERLFRILSPDAYLLAYFHPETAPQRSCAHLCRIVDDKTLMMRARGAPRMLQPFNNRAIERLFQRFRTVKFFLTRDHLREIIVQR